VSIRAAKRNARRATNYGVPMPFDGFVTRAAREGTCFNPQQPSALAQRTLEDLLSNGKRLVLEQERNAGDRIDGDEAQGHDRVDLRERETLPIDTVALGRLGGGPADVGEGD